MKINVHDYETIDNKFQCEKCRATRIRNNDVGEDAMVLAAKKIKDE